MEIRIKLANTIVASLKQDNPVDIVAIRVLAWVLEIPFTHVKRRCAKKRKQLKDEDHFAV